MAPVAHLFGGIEAGAMKFVCAVGELPVAIHDSTSIPTTTPTATLSEVIAFFQPYALYSLGLATFGLIALDRGSSTYGHIISRGNVLSITNG
jgi:fructokinase